MSCCKHAPRPLNRRNRVPCVHCRHHGARCTATSCERVRPGPYTLDMCRPCWLRLSVPPADAIVVNQGAGGVGDGILGLWAAAGVRRANPGRRIVYKCGPRAMPFVALFDGYDYLAEHDFDDDDKRGGFPGLQLNRGYAHEMRTRGHVPRVERYCRNAGGVEPVEPRLRDPGAVRAAGADWAGAVVLAPFSAWSDREWSPRSWETLEALLAEAGHRTVIVCDDGPRAATMRSPAVVGAEAARVAGILLGARCVVGLDSGLSHLAGALGAPTVVMTAQTAAGVWTAYPTVRPLRGSLRCAGCYWNPPFSAATCRPYCPSIQGITPQTVMGEVDRVPPTLVSGDRLAVLAQTARECCGLPGDMAELGVYGGGSAAVIADACPAKTLRLFDTFAGLPSDDVGGGIHRRGEFACSLSDVRRALGGRNVAYHPGMFPATAAGLADVRFCFVHLDADLYQSTRDAIAYFWPRLVPGGCMVYDDFGWEATPGIERAVAEAGLAVERTAAQQARARKPGG